MQFVREGTGFNVEKRNRTASLTNIVYYLFVFYSILYVINNSVFITVIHGLLMNLFLYFGVSICITAGMTDLNGELKDAYSFIGIVIDPPQFGTWLIQEVGIFIMF